MKKRRTSTANAVSRLDTTYGQPPMQLAKDCAALLAAVDVPGSQLVHPLGKPPHADVLFTHCKMPGQPAALVHAASALAQSGHFVGLHEQRSNAPPSPALVVALLDALLVDDVAVVLALAVLSALLVELVAGVVDWVKDVLTLVDGDALDGLVPDEVYPPLLEVGLLLPTDGELVPLPTSAPALPFFGSSPGSAAHDAIQTPSTMRAPERAARPSRMGKPILLPSACDAHPGLGNIQCSTSIR